MVTRAVASQQLRVKEKITDIVLDNPDVSVVKSLHFVKQLTTTAVSSISFLRGFFPADAFVEKRLAGQHVYILRGCDEIPGTKTLINWIKGSYELLDSHHLRKMMLVVQKDLSPLEMYTFSFSYNHDAIQYDVTSGVDGSQIVLEQSQSLPDDIEKSVRQVIRSILTHATTLQVLPDGCTLSLKFQLDKDTPEELIPDFIHSSSEAEGFQFPDEAEKLKLGKVASKFTTLSVTSKTIMNGMYNYDEANQEVNVDCSQDSEDIVPSSQNPDFKMASFTSNSSCLARSQLTGKKVPENNSSSTNLSEKLSIASLKEKTISCICECNDPLDDTVRCVSCSTFQHKACYKMLEDHQVESHICIKCHDPDMGKPCSVPELLNDDNIKDSALYRQALVYCRDSSQVSCKRIMTYLKVKRPTAEKIMQRLEADGCLELATNRGQVRNVKADFQESILGRLFTAPPESTPMDIQQSPLTVVNGTKSCVKRQQSENKENISFENISPLKKRQKTTKNLKFSSAEKVCLPSKKPSNALQCN